MYRITLKRIFIPIVWFFLILLWNCTPNEGTLYLRTNYNGIQITTLKIVKQHSNQFSQNNILNQNSGKILFEDSQWNSYNISCGEHEIYIEYMSLGTFKNERETILLSPKTDKAVWTAVWITNDSINPLRIEYGCGEFKISENLD
jgi:hypothetical protein